jgi:hypothetical protein
MVPIDWFVAAAIPRGIRRHRTEENHLPLLCGQPLHGPAGFGESARKILHRAVRRRGFVPDPLAFTFGVPGKV